MPLKDNILKSTSREGVDLLKKQLLGTQLNQFDGRGLAEPYASLQTLLLQWGEYLVKHHEDFDRQDLIQAKDVFDGINNTSHF